jgi:hypothetical protein
MPSLDRECLLERLEFVLPRLKDELVPWRRWIDTDRSPNEIVEQQEAKLVFGRTHQARSVVMRIAGISKLSKSSTEENQNGDKDDRATRRNGG